MLRAVLVGLLAVTATSSCSDSGDTAKVAPGAVAGKVIDVTGEVTAVRGGVTRKLAASAEVFADDEIDTANGSVQIRLHHNGATWAVESGQRTRVDASLAWQLEKQGGVGTRVDHASSAAGREGERTAADTRASSETAAPRAAAAMPTAPPAAAPAAPAPTTTPAAPPAPVRPSSRLPAEIARGGGVDGAPKPGPTVTGGGESRKGLPSQGRQREVVGAPGGADAPNAALAVPVAAPEVAAFRTALAQRRAQLAQCLPAGARYRLVVKVVANQLTLELDPTGAAPAVVACLSRAVRAVPRAKALTATETLELAR